MANSPNIPKPTTYASQPPRSAAWKTIVYLALRIGIAIAGLLIILVTLSSHILTPELLYDEPPGPPPLPDRLARIVLSLGIGVLLCLPHRWTTRNSLFWPRFALYVLIAAFAFWRAIEGTLAGLTGGKSWHIIPLSLLMAFMALTLPLCLLWSRRIARAT